MTNNNATHDAWIIGEHEYPVEAPVVFMHRKGDVLVHVRRKNGRWSILTPEEFAAQYRWVAE